MDLSQDQLRAFYEISKLKNFTSAARELGITQSALSHRIKKHEVQLETVLLIRDPNGVRLTESGLKLLEFCRLQHQIENEFLNELKSSNDKDIKGHIRIGGVSTLLWSTVIPALSELLNKYSALNFDVLEREMNELPDLLKSGRVDYIITCGKIKKSNFEEIYIGEEVNALFESKKTSSRSNYYIDHDPNDQTTFDFFKIQNQKHSPLSRSYLDNISGIIAGVEAGLGKAVIPIHLVKMNHQLKKVPHTKNLKIPVYLYVLKQPFYSKLQKIVIQSLSENIPQFLK